MNKKGIIKIQAEFIVNLIFFLMVFIILLSAVLIIKNNKLHILRVEARDYALTRDAVITSPYEINYQYKLNENISLSFNKDNCLVQVKYKDGPDTPIIFSCGIDKINQIDQQEVENNIIIKAIQGEQTTK